MWPQSRVIANYAGGDELIGLALRIGAGNHLLGGGSFDACALGDGAIGGLHPLPTVIAVQSIVAANDCANLRALWQLLLQAGEIARSRAGADIAPVGNGMDEDGNAHVTK